MGEATGGALAAQGVSALSREGLATVAPIAAPYIGAGLFTGSSLNIANARTWGHLQLIPVKGDEKSSRSYTMIEVNNPRNAVFVPVTRRQFSLW